MLASSLRHRPRARCPRTHRAEAAAGDRFDVVIGSVSVALYRLDLGIADGLCSYGKLPQVTVSILCASYGLSSHGL